MEGNINNLCLFRGETQFISFRVTITDNLTFWTGRWLMVNGWKLNLFARFFKSGPRKWTHTNWPWTWTWCGESIQVTLKKLDGVSRMSGTMFNTLPYSSSLVGSQVGTGRFDMSSLVIISSNTFSSWSATLMVFQLRILGCQEGTNYCKGQILSFFASGIQLLDLRTPENYMSLFCFICLQ